MHLKEVVDRFGRLWLEVRRNLVIIVVMAIVLTAVGAFIAIRSDNSYSSSVKFMVNEEDGGGSRISSVLGSLGFGMGGGGSSANLPKILEIASSNIITKEVLLETIVVSSKPKLIIDHLLDFYPLNDKVFETYPAAANKSFTEIKIADSIAANFILKNRERMLVGTADITGLVTNLVDDATGMMTVSVKSLDPELSVGLSKVFYANLSDYYIKRTTEPQIESFNQISFKVDSIRNRIGSLDMQLATLNDGSKGLIMSRDKLKQSRIERDLQISSLAYGKALENLELAEFALSTARPYFQLVDETYLPIEPERPSLLKYGVIFGFFGFFVSLSYVLVRWLWRQAMME